MGRVIYDGNSGAVAHRAGRQPGYFGDIAMLDEKSQADVASNDGEHAGYTSGHQEGRDEGIRSGREFTRQMVGELQAGTMTFEQAFAKLDRLDKLDQEVKDREAGGLVSDPHDMITQYVGQVALPGMPAGTQPVNNPNIYK